MNINDVKFSVAGNVLQPVKVEPFRGITEILREHEDGTGFTMTTKDARSAFSMAEKMAFSGNKYSIKLGKQPGEDWVLVVDEVAE